MKSLKQVSILFLVSLFLVACTTSDEEKDFTIYGTWIRVKEKRIRIGEETVEKNLNPKNGDVQNLLSYFKTGVLQEYIPRSADSGFIIYSTFEIKNDSVFIKPDSAMDFHKGIHQWNSSTNLFDNFPIIGSTSNSRTKIDALTISEYRENVFYRDLLYSVWLKQSDNPTDFSLNIK